MSVSWKIVRVVGSQRRVIVAVMLAGLTGVIPIGSAQESAGSDQAVSAAAPSEITPAIRKAIERGAQYLVSTQNHDGSWRTNGGSGGYPVAMTSLAGLALMGGGSTPTQGVYAKNVSGALTFILKSARRDGLIAQLEEESHCMHGHGFAMLFLAQCYGMEENPRGRRRCGWYWNERSS